MDYVGKECFKSWWTHYRSYTIIISGNSINDIRFGMLASPKEEMERTFDWTIACSDQQFTSGFTRGVMSLKLSIDEWIFNWILLHSLSELESMEYRPIRVTGKFLHNRELLMGPRSLITPKDEHKGGLLTQQDTSIGYLIITPFQLDNTEYKPMVIYLS